MNQDIYEPILKVYDMRMMRTGMHIPCKQNIYFLRFLPTFSSQVAIITESGLWNVIDLMHPETAAHMFYSDSKQVRIEFLLGLAT